MTAKVNYLLVTDRPEGRAYYRCAASPVNGAGLVARP